MEILVARSEDRWGMVAVEDEVGSCPYRTRAWTWRCSDGSILGKMAARVADGIPDEAVRWWTECDLAAAVLEKEFPRRRLMVNRPPLRAPLPYSVLDQAGEKPAKAFGPGLWVRRPLVPDPRAAERVRRRLEEWVAESEDPFDLDPKIAELYEELGIDPRYI